LASAHAWAALSSAAHSGTALATRTALTTARTCLLRNGADRQNGHECEDEEVSLHGFLLHG
jgi:hypothetical protein